MPTKRGVVKAKRGVKAKPAKSRSLDSSQKTCPGCGGSNIIFDALMAQVICHDCGQMFEELPEEMQRLPKES